MGFTDLKPDIMDFGDRIAGCSWELCSNKGDVVGICTSPSEVVMDGCWLSTIGFQSSLFLGERVTWLVSRTNEGTNCAAGNFHQIGIGCLGSREEAVKCRHEGTSFAVEDLPQPRLK